MNQIQDKSEIVFSSQDLVVWHTRVEKYVLPIPAVVVRQKENSVLIRARVDGKIQELEVSPEELAER